MATVLTTGQLTIVDNNDAKPITAYITLSSSSQAAATATQVYTGDEQNITYNPNWDSAITQSGVNGTPLVLTAKVYVGSTTDKAPVLAGRWRYSAGGTDIFTSNTTSVTASTSNSLSFTTGTLSVNNYAYQNVLTLSANLKPDSSPLTLYYEADYTDPVTTLSSHIIAQITLTQVKAGNSAIWVRVSGQTKIEPSTSGQAANKQVIIVYADLMRPTNTGGIDNTVSSYAWYQSTPVSTQVTQSSLNTTHGLMDLASVTAFQGGWTGAMNASAVNKFWVGGTGSTGLTAGNIPNGKGLIIHEDAINSIGVYEVRITDSGSPSQTYSTFFTVNDVSDPYTMQIASSAGDKLQNGVGTTILTPKIYYGGSPVTNLLGWTFHWQLFNRDGNRGGFVNTSNTVSSSGWLIASHTTGANASFTITGGSGPVNLATGSLIKVVKSDTVNAAFYQLAAPPSGGTLTIQTPTGAYDLDPTQGTTGSATGVSSWLNYSIYPYPTGTGDYVGGRLFACDYWKQTTGASSGGGTLDYSASNAAGNEIDAKGTFVCSAIKGSL